MQCLLYTMIIEHICFYPSLIRIVHILCISNCNFRASTKAIRQKQIFYATKRSKKGEGNQTQNAKGTTLMYPLIIRVWLVEIMVYSRVARRWWITSLILNILFLIWSFRLRNLRSFSFIITFALIPLIF